MKKTYPIARPFIDEDDKRSVLSVLDTPYLSIGPKVVEFEKKFADFIGTEHACAVNSGTAGLHLALITIGIGAGDEVITTPFSFVASSNAILYVGAKPVFVDIEPVTFNIDPEKIESKITSKTKAILVVHVFGQTADMGRIIKIARKYKLKIIEDACESIGAKYHGKKAGTFGNVAVFAFYPNKQMTTGEGGIIVTDNKRIHALCCSLRNQGRAANMGWLDHKYLGYNYRLDEMSAALGVSQIKKINFLINKKKEIAGWYNEFLKDSDVINPPVIGPGRDHSWFVYVITVNKNRKQRDEIIKNLDKAGVHAKTYFPSIHLFSFYRKSFNFKRGDFPVSEKISNGSIALPFYIGISKDDVKYICRELFKML
ncbi:MAG: Glutamine--scyllo-inositol transaminase [Parcubacteria group bacterium Licking1014_17]|nr:MAG: Glutamine--scyllo-inositol transaminase [Parcubacteria group bacterium Licking1014_17]